MKYSTSTQDFSTLRKEGLHYVDKTRQICRLRQSSRYLFLARPRRFGKSLTVSTLKELYSGSAELFEGTWAGEHWDFPAEQCPVLWFRFASLDYGTKGVTAALREEIRRQADGLGVVLEAGQTLKDSFKALIHGSASAHPGGRVVVLVDEYDKPIIDYLDDAPKAEANRDELRSFYSVLKDADPYIELVFITGVSAFSKVSLFSDLNNLVNLTLHPAAATLLGLTQREIEDNFGPQLDATGYSREEVKRWYNGYAWDEDQERVYDPWSILQFLETGRVQNFWSDSGTPTFVTRLLARGGDYDIAPVTAEQTQLASFNLARLDPIAILFQTGYLTVHRQQRDLLLYELDYPNEEVRRTFQIALLGEYGFRSTTGAVTRVMRLKRAFAARDLESVVEIIEASLANVPYQLWA